ncbi:MAG: SRPBCC family protein [Halobaculum sp.]
MTVTASVEIDAPPERVWETLLAFDHYPDWNPLIRRIEGRPAVGRTIRAIIDQPMAPPLPLHATVTRFDPERELAWETNIPSAGLLTVTHRFRLRPIASGERTEFTQVEELDGSLGRAVPDRLIGFLADGFVEMNEALVRRVESRQDVSDDGCHDHNR